MNDTCTSEWIYDNGMGLPNYPPATMSKVIAKHVKDENLDLSIESLINWQSQRRAYNISKVKQNTSNDADDALASLSSLKESNKT